jgi:hypothetical protein
VSQCFIPLETLAIPFPLLWNLVLVPTHSQNKKKIPSLASHARIEGESLGSVFLMEGALRERKLQAFGHFVTAVFFRPEYNSAGVKKKKRV